jgi:flagellar hook capping protein FlgD
VEQDIHQYYEAGHPGEVVVLGADLFNGTPSALGGFKQSTGATYPLLLISSIGTGGNIQALYGERDHVVVISKQGIVRYQANDHWAYGGAWLLNDVRGCVDSLLTSAAGVRPNRLFIREPVQRPRQEPPSSPQSGLEDAASAGASLRVAAEPTRSTFAVALANPSGRAEPARVTVHDLAGRRVATLFDGPAAPGLTTLTWDGRDRAGRAAASGVYHVRAEIAGSTLSRRIALVR